MGSSLIRSAFSPIQHRGLERLLEAILPEDPSTGFPGAARAGVIDYIGYILGKDELSPDIPRWRVIYLTSLPEIENAAMRLYSTRLAELSLADATSLLDAMRTNSLSGVPESVEQSAFFWLLRLHCVQGAFAHPRWGGNRNGSVWRWFGYSDVAGYERWTP